MRVTQINLNETFVGGGEIFTVFLCRALEELNVQTQLIAHVKAKFWKSIGLPNSTEIHATSLAKLNVYSCDSPTWLLSHGPLPTTIVNNPKHWRTAIAHMPIQGRNPREFVNHDMIFPVSKWVQKGLINERLPTWTEPLYSVAALLNHDADTPVLRTSRYKWDKRKGRDQVLGIIEPLIETLRTVNEFKRKPELTIGIVSQLVPVKQFPLLFSHLIPVLLKYPKIRFEIFGRGAYASVRDFDYVLRPIKDRVRFWGQQTNLAAIYPQLDYLLSGLPEKEALGLNIIEAQACGTPVIAVNAPPFTETVVDGVTGFLYRDPREDNGADFERLITELQSGRPRPRPELAADHLARFSFPAFVERLRPVVAEAETQLSRR